jgi:hypothetical protein
MRVVAYEARAVYDADGNSAMSSVSEDIVVLREIWVEDW